MRDALAVVCAVAGLDPRGAVPLKVTANAVFRLASAPVVVRVATSPTLLHRVDKVVTVARWLAARDVAAVRLLPGVPQPVRAGGHVATFWVDAGSGRDQPGVADLARALRTLHRLPPPTPVTTPGPAGETSAGETSAGETSGGEGMLPGWTPLDDIRRRLADAEGLDDADREFLLARTDRIDAELADIRYTLPTAVVHGDAHLGNLIRARDGRILLCDFDSACIGPPEWDLVPIPVGQARFGYPRQRQRQFAERYGFDVVSWPGYPTLRALRELKLTTSAVPMLRSSPSIAAQFAIRLWTLRTGDEAVRWTPYR